MAQKTSMTLHYQLHHSSIKRARNLFNESGENSYSLVEQWTVLCYVQSVQLLHNQQHQRKTQCNRPNSLLITLQQNKKISSHSMQVTLNWRQTVTPATWVNRKHAAGQEAISPIKRFHHNTKQQISPQHSPHNKTCNFISNISRVGGFIHNGQGGVIHQNHFGRNVTQTAPHTIANR